MLAFFIVFSILLIFCLAIVLFYVIRFAKIIFLLEDNLEDAIEVHERSVETFESLLNMPLFFDSPEIKRQTNEALEDVKLCKLATQRLIDALTRTSKQKYIRVEETTERSELD